MPRPQTQLRGAGLDRRVAHGHQGNCGQCHGGTTTALTWFNNYTPKDAVLAPPHIPYLPARTAAACHAANYVTGGFGPTNMTQATHAFVPSTCDTCHEAGLASIWASAIRHCRADRPITPADRWSRRMTAASAMRPPTGTPPCCRPGTCPIPATRPVRSVTPAAPADYSPRRWRRRRAAHRHQRRLRPMSRRQRTADLVQQLHTQGRRADAVAHPVPGGHRLFLLSRRPTTWRAASGRPT